jgi:mannosyltransferase
MTKNEFSKIELLIGNSSRKFSGGTSIMLQLLDYQNEIKPIIVIGNYFVPSHIKSISFISYLKIARTPPVNGKDRIFYARRNDEMIQALIAKWLFGAKIKIVFSSSAQRSHTNFTKWLMNRMDALVSTSKMAASYLSSRSVDRIIPHGIDTKRFQPPANKDSAWQSLGYPGSFGVGIFGRVRYSKGIDILVDAGISILPNHPHVSIIICGECIPTDILYKQKMLDKIKLANLEDRIIFIGKQSFKDLPKIFQGMKVVAALSRNEGYGLTPLEGMASGAAVLTSEEGAWKEIVRNDLDGFCVPTDNIEATKIKLEELISNHDKTAEMGINATKNILDNYSIETEAKRIIEFVEAI